VCTDKEHDKSLSFMAFFIHHHHHHLFQSTLGTPFLLQELNPQRGQQVKKNPKKNPLLDYHDGPYHCQWIVTHT